MEDLWVKGVQDAVQTAALELGAQSIGLIGHEKDESSYYLRMFPQWPLVESPNIDGRSATELRDLILAPNGRGSCVPVVFRAIWQSWCGIDRTNHFG